MNNNARSNDNAIFTCNALAMVFKKGWTDEEKEVIEQWRW